MDIQSNPSLVKKQLRLVGAGFLIAVFLIVMAVFIGWSLQLDLLRRFSSASPPMSPLTATAFFIAALALIPLRDLDASSESRIRSRILSGFVMALGVLNVCLFLFDIKFQYGVPPNTAGALIVAGVAIFLMAAKQTPGKKPYAQYFAIISLLGALLSIYGFVFDVSLLSGITPFTPMALSSAIALLFLSAGALFIRPHQGPLAILVVEEQPAEIAFLTFGSFIIPLVLGWIILQLQEKQIFSNEFGTALFAISTHIIAMFLTGRKALVDYRIVELKRASERRYQEDAKKLKSILENWPSAIAIRDNLSIFTELNNQYGNVHGINSKTAKGKSVMELFPYSKAIELKKKDDEILNKGVTESSEEVIKVNGEDAYFYTTRFPLADLEGDIYAVCWLSTDITELKKSQQKIEENERVLKAIVENLGEGVAVSDNSGKFLVFNRLAKKITGKDQRDIAPEEWSKEFGVYYPDCKNPFPPEELPLYRALKGEPTSEVEMCIKNQAYPKGIIVSVTGSPVTLSEGRLAVVVFRDITKKKELELELKNSEKRLRTVLSTIGEGVAVSDPKGKFLLFNKKAAALLGKSATDVDPDSWSEQYDILRPDQKTRFPPNQLPLYRALQGETVKEVELYIRLPGEKGGRNILVNSSPIMDADGGIVAAVADFRDITEYRNLEEAVKELRERFNSLSQ